MFALASLLLILNLGYWQETMETLAQVIFATLVCIAVGVPLGIVAAHSRGSTPRCGRCWT